MEQTIKYQPISEEVFKYERNLHPFIDFVNEDFSQYPTASSMNFKDKDGDFCIGDSSGFLMRMDFIIVNADEYSESARHFVSTCSSPIADDGCYTYAREGTIEYKMFWKEETRRRRKGLIRNCKLYKKDIALYNACKTDNERSQFLFPLRITGDHYNYLNYGRINRTPTKEERILLDKEGKEKQTVLTGFPRMWDGDYWNFKVDEFVAANKYHLCKGKARRKGYSNKRGSQAANTINLTPQITIILAAYQIDYLTDVGATADMLKRNLDWYENHTYWFRGYLTEALDNIELGYKDKKKGNQKFGFRSKAISVTCKDNPDAAIGKQAVEIDFEEAGKFPNIQETFDTTVSATEVGDEIVGTLRVYGTGGSKEANWEPFSRIFRNPHGNKMMPFENVWDLNSRHTVCGFFHPQILNMEPHMDKDGNSFLVKSFYADKEAKDFKKKNSTVTEHALFASQRANSPSESFNTDNENIFSSIELNEHIKWVRQNESFIKFREGQFIRNKNENTKFVKENDNNEEEFTQINKNISNIVFKTNSELSIDNKVHPYIKNVPFESKDDIHGCWRIYNEPKYINGSIPDNLYYSVVDPIGKDKTIKEVTTKNSLNAIYIISYLNNLGIAPDTIQAVYVGRTETMDGCSEEALKAAEYYNAKVLPETDRGTVVADFKRWNQKHRLIKNPLVVISAKVNDVNINDYGVNIGEGDNAVNAIIGLKQWLYEIVNKNEDGSNIYRLHYIFDLPTLLELQKYNSKGNFDRVSALRLLSLLRTAFITKKLQANINTNGTLAKSIGLYNF